MTTVRPRVKICGLTRSEDAHLADAAGAHYLGVVLTAGFGRSLGPDDAVRVLGGVNTIRVAVVVDEAPGAAARLAETIDAGVLQLHGSEDRASVSTLRGLGGWTIWKAIRARSSDDVRRAVDDLADVVDGFLVEGWRAGVTGGAGVRLEVDADAVRSAIPADRSFVLAGGLSPENVRGAVARFAPEVVDVSSGVERAPGIKDPELVRGFIQSALGGMAPSATQANRP